MANATGIYAEITELSPVDGVIDEALRALRINGTLLLREPYAPPWSIAIPDAKTLGELLGVERGTGVVAFHLVELGHCVIKPEKGDEQLLAAGDMAICFGGVAHTLAQGKSAKPQPVEQLLAGGRNLRRPDAADRQVGAALICGAFLVHHTDFNPLFAALPPVLHARLSRSGELHNLSGVARLFAEEIDRGSSGGGYIVERLLEVLCADAIRAHVEAAPHDKPGWFRGIRDPVIGRAIAAMHAEPGGDWTVLRLASIVAISPSRFAARFSDAVGESPMAYLTKWRMSLACRQLASSRDRIDRIAAGVGYDNQAAFGRAFRKHVGMSPASWRSRHAIGPFREDRASERRANGISDRHSDWQEGQGRSATRRRGARAR